MYFEEPVVLLPSVRSSPETAPPTEMSHDEMISLWRQGLVTPMSATISTFAKTGGSWWALNDASWSRVAVAQRNEELDFHHERFGRVEQARGPGHAAGRSPWDSKSPLGR